MLPELEIENHQTKKHICLIAWVIIYWPMNNEDPIDRPDKIYSWKKTQFGCHAIYEDQIIIAIFRVKEKGDPDPETPLIQ
jgi:hypothetical protein